MELVTDSVLLLAKSVSYINVRSFHKSLYYIANHVKSYVYTAVGHCNNLVLVNINLTAFKRFYLKSPNLTHATVL